MTNEQTQSLINSATPTKDQPFGVYNQENPYTMADAARDGYNMAVAEILTKINQQVIKTQGEWRTFLESMIKP